MLPTSVRLRASLLLLLLVCFRSVPLAAGELRGGFAKADITPTAPVMLAGYASRKEPSATVHDPLFARAVALEQDDRRLVLISIDNCGFYNATSDPLRQGILSATQLKPSELFLCATHTHSAPLLGLDPQKVHTNNVQYTQRLETRLAELARQALDHLAPIKVAVGAGSSPVGANRREVIKDKEGKPKVILGRNPSLAIDREVQVLRFVSLAGENPAGVVFVGNTHSTSLGAANNSVSGDVHGLAAQFVENCYGDGFTAAAFAGASGNIDPWYRVLSGFRTNNGWIPEPVLLGTMLGEEVIHVLEKGAAPMTNATIRTDFKTITVPGKNGDDESANAPVASMNITVARLGEVAFVGWGGEVFNEIGKSVKDKSPFPNTFILTHCNGAAGYLPVSACYPEGGYEVQSSHFARGADEVLIRETLGMLKALKQQN